MLLLYKIQTHSIFCTFHFLKITHLLETKANENNGDAKMKEFVNEMHYLQNAKHLVCDRMCCMRRFKCSLECITDEMNMPYARNEMMVTTPAELWAQTL